MADFRIDRIRFRWRGDWSANTLYVKDDVLRYGAKVFVCVEVHTSDTNFYNDLNNSTPRWVQMMDGQSWTGDWQPSTFYKIGELVKVGGLIYKCIEGHISNASASNGVLGDELKWVYFARGEDYQSVWQPNTLYNVDQTVVMVVQFGNVTQHTHLHLLMMVYNSMRHIGINIQDQITLEAIG